MGQLQAGIVQLATFLMAMALAAMGLQMDLVRLRVDGAKVAATALLGWVFIAALAAGALWCTVA